MQVRSQVPEIPPPPAAQPERVDRAPATQGLPLRTPLPVGGPSSRSEKATIEPAPRNRHWAELPSGDHVLRPGTELTDDRPPLPKRRRQTHLAPQLHREPEPPIGDELSDDPDSTARQAQSMMAAFQRGTQRGRADPDLSEP
jgi:hypothetical protein